MFVIEMVCDNDQSSSDPSAVLESSLDEDNEEPQHPIGTGVGYVSPTAVSPEIPNSKNKYKNNPPVSEVEIVQNTNSSEYMGTLDSNKAISSTTESTTVSVDTTTKHTTKNSINVSKY